MSFPSRYPSFRTGTWASPLLEMTLSPKFE
jgi:hypothetical protein